VTSVLLIDDHPIVLQGCKSLLETIGVCGIDEAQSTSEAFRLYRKSKPEVIIVDLAMRAGPLSGLSFLRWFRRVDESTSILVLTMHRDPLIVSSVFELGANGYVLKSAGPDEFVQAFQKMCEGGFYLSRELASDPVFRRLEVKSTKFDGLTSREVQILTLLAAGKPHKRIGEKLNISGSTVAKASTQLKVKLGVRTRSELIRVALEHLSAAESRASASIMRRRRRGRASL